MRKFICILACLLIFTGCAPSPHAESVNNMVNTPHLTNPPALSSPPVDIVGSSSSTPEPTEPDPTVPFEITAEEVSKRLNGKFSFGTLYNQEVKYYWYPQGDEVHEPEDYNFVEARFTYNNIEYVVRVKETPCRMDLTFEDLPWEEETKETEILLGLTGTVRKCRVGKTLYTNVLWYNAEQRCTYSMYWKGGREDYKKLAPIVLGYPGTQVNPG